MAPCSASSSSVASAGSGDDVGSCVVVDLTPELPNNCSAVFRLPGGNITTQFSSSPGPASSPLR